VAEENTRVRTGGCICRGLTFRVTGDPLRVGIFHCMDCRKTSGAAFAVLRSGPVRHLNKRRGAPGRSFCSTCGGRVASIREDEAEVMIGALNEGPTDLTPEYEIWTGRRESWLVPLSSATQFDKDADFSGVEIGLREQPETEASSNGNPPV
jgi:hypothetical protein